MDALENAGRLLSAKSQSRPSATAFTALVPVRIRGGARPRSTYTRPDGRPADDGDENIASPCAATRECPASGGVRPQSVPRPTCDWRWPCPQIRWRRSAGNGGRPWRFHLKRKNSWNPLRCHRISVSGWTIITARRQSINRDRIMSAIRVASSARRGFTPRHPRTARSSPEDEELMPQHDDFELLEIGRATAQGREPKHPAKHQVTKREEHEASRSRDCRPILRIGFYASG
jgi:hypothetical protein